jgi:uncharacterized protein YciI
MTLFVVTYRNRAAPPQALVGPHLAFLEDLRRTGAVLANGRLIGGPGGLVLVRAESVEAARTLLAADPYVEQDVSDVEIFEWDAKWAEGGHERG